MKVLVSDFDNTLFTLHYLENIEAIQKFVKNGNYFILTTEKNHTQIISEIENFNIPYSFLICDDGALIYDFYGNVLFDKKMDKSLVTDIYNFLQKSHLFYNIWYDNGEDYVTDIDLGVYKIISKPKNYDKIDEFLIKIKDKFDDIQIQIADNWIHIFDKQISKASAIEYLVKNYELDKDEIYTVGYDNNDLSMIKNYHGFVMNDSSDELKRYAEGNIEKLEDIIDKLMNKI